MTGSDGDVKLHNAFQLFSQMCWKVILILRLQTHDEATHWSTQYKKKENVNTLVWTEKQRVVSFKNWSAFLALAPSQMYKINRRL